MHVVSLSLWAWALIAAVASPPASPAQPVLAEDLMPQVGVLSVFPLEGRALAEIRARMLSQDLRRHCQMVTPGEGLTRQGALAVYIARARESATAVVRRLPDLPPGGKSKVIAKTAPIASATADLLEQVWEMMLERVRLPPRDLDQWNDAATYYFDTCCMDRVSPPGGAFVRASGRPTRPEQLARIGDALAAYVEADVKDRAAREATLVELARALRAELAALGGSIPDLEARRASAAVEVVIPPPKGHRGGATK
jgi:hypothetical protein